MTPSSSRSLADLFLARVAATPDAAAFLYPDNHGWATLTWRDTGERVRALACGLLALGLSKGDRVAIASATRIEWVLADLAIGCAGGVTATVYPLSADEDAGFILADSAATILIAENASQAERVSRQRATLPDLRHVIAFDGAHAPGVVSWADLLARGRAWDASHPGEFERAAGSASRTDLATLIYTSGTTGRPKGVELPHDCWLFEVESIGSLNLLGPADVQFLWLPLAHVFGKMCIVLGVGLGFATAVDGRPERIAANLAAVRPTFVCMVPRIFERVHARVQQQARAGGAMQAALFAWALRIGTTVARRRHDGLAVSSWLRTRWRVADALVLSKVRARFGGRLRFFICGSVALAPELTSFFAALGLTILEGYGLSESTAMTVSNLPGRNRWGTVGMPIPGMELSFAPDGEILLRGRGVMRGYFGQPTETAAAIDPDGWLHTGDIGARDASGHLVITDRKKDLIKTSGGKYVSPQHVEGHLTLEIPMIAQAVVHGEGRPFCTALLSLAEAELRAWASAAGLPDAPYDRLVRHQPVVELVAQHVARVNARLARYEEIRRWAILPRELTVEAGELTPSLKVRRRVIEQRYRDVLDELYADAITSPSPLSTLRA